MRKLSLLVLLPFSLLFISLSNPLTETRFYSADGKSISLQEIEEKWNQRLKEEEIDSKISEIKILQVKDKGQSKKVKILLASTENELSKTWVELSEYKDGFQLSRKTISCHSGCAKFYFKRVDGNWVCKLKKNHKAEMRKVESLKFSN